MELFNIAAIKFQDFALILIRITSFFLIAPFFAFRFIPTYTKILFSAIISYMILYCLPEHNYVIKDALTLIIVVIHQVCTGVILGIVANLVFEGIRLAGMIIDLQMGFSMVNVIDPVTQIRQTLFGEYNYLLSVFLFVVLDGHHVLLLNLISSFEKVPLYQLGFSHAMNARILESFCNLFVIGLKIALPILAILLIIDVVTGLISRLIPQLNIFVISFPFKITTGFVAMVILLPQILDVYKRLFYHMYINLKTLF